MRTMTGWLLPFVLALATPVHALVRRHHHHRPHGPVLPAIFVDHALCVHAGRFFTTTWSPGRKPVYAMYGHVFYFVHPTYDDLPHGVAGNDGEGSWPGTVGDLYGGGMSFMVGTWNRAATVSDGRVPHVESTYEIARQPASVQVLAMWLIVRQDGGRFGEWPETGRSCQAPM